MMKGDNFVIGVSSVDSSMINLRKRVWSESLSESDSAYRHFSFVLFFCLGFGVFCIHRDFCWVHWLRSPPTTEPYEGKYQEGNSFTLANQGYTFSILTLKKRTRNLGSLGFHSQVYYSSREKRGNLGLSSEMIDPAATTFCYWNLWKSFAGLWHVQPIDQIVLSDHLSSPVRAKMECC